MRTSDDDVIFIPDVNKYNIVYTRREYTGEKIDVFVC